MNTVTKLFGGGRPVEPTKVTIRDADRPEGIEQVNDPNEGNAGVTAELSEVSAKVEVLTRERAELDRRFADSQRHIGQLESDNAVLRREYEIREAPQTEVRENPFEDPTNQEYLAELAKNDPAKLGSVISDYAVNRAQEISDANTEPLKKQVEAQQAATNLLHNFQRELEVARQLSPECAAVVQEAVDSDFSAGALVEAIGQNRNLVAVSGGVAGLVSMLAMTGNYKESAAQATTTVAASRPQGQTKVLEEDTGPTEEEEIEAHKARIRNVDLGNKLQF